jgi:acyl transferase domain-containing protein
MISDVADKISIAAVNSPQSVTLGGDVMIMQEVVVPRFKEAGAFNALLRVSHAFHTSQMEPIKDSLMRSLSNIKPQTPTVPIYSSVSGALHEGLHGAEYWWDNVRKPVLFYQAAQAGLKGCDVVLEIAPHPVLTPNLKQILDPSVQIACTLNRKVEEERAVLSALAQLYTVGVSVDWKSMYANVPTEFVRLPLYLSCFSLSFPPPLGFSFPTMYYDILGAHSLSPLLFFFFHLALLFPLQYNWRWLIYLYSVYY